MLRNQAEEGTSGAMMFKSGGRVLKQGYVRNETETAATMCNLKMNNVIASPRAPPAVTTRRRRTAGRTRESRKGASGLVFALAPKADISQTCPLVRKAVIQPMN